MHIQDSITRKSILIKTVFILALGLFFVSTSLVGALAGSDQESYPIKKFKNGKARHFEYETKDGITIKYFIIKSSDGVIRAAFDACDVCWHAGKGYAQKKDVMICRNCGMKFPTYSINEVSGGCNPAPLKRTVVGDQLVIKHSDIEAGKGYFDFSK